MSLNNAITRVVNNNFHALTHRNFRYYWFGQCVSLIGTWMQNIGQSWLVLKLTGSPFLLGLVGTTQFMPVTFFSLFAGVVIDRFPKKLILLITQTVAMILAFILSILVFTGQVQYGYILVLAFILGLTNTFDMPTRQAFTIEIVGKDDLMNAIALNSTTFNLARVVGPAIGASMMAFLGAGWCFMLNGFSFLAVIYSLTRIEATPYVRPKKPGSGMMREIRDGFRYIAQDRLLSQTLLLLAVIGTLGFNFNVLIPAFTQNVLHMEEGTYGFLMSAIGVGSLIGALTISVRSKQGPRLGLIMICSAAVSVLLTLTGFTSNMYITAMVLALIGVSNIFFTTNCNSLLQIHSKDEYRARVMSIYSLVFTGSTPLGNLFAGSAAERLGPDGAFILSGVLAFIPIMLILLLFRLKRKPAPAQAGIPD
ncbi:MAG: arabinose efflux permease family protein [Paenibacillaceae bacterium]|jgi:predicted MFS family arabinose efflux permease|nr:arabinose efflux permease family protein [Paenibacillaceae bacterium]